MKEPPVLHRRRRPSSSLAAKKMKLVCSFNGSFQPRPPSGKLRYVGGETRIISVDRSIELSKLRSKILDLFPATRPRYFSLKYQLPNLGCDDAPLLVSVASDDDVRCMIEEYDKLDLYGKHARLWLFVCTEDNDDVDVNIFIKKEGTLLVNCGESKSLCTKNGVASVKGVKVVKGVSGCEALKGQLNCELTKNLAKYGDVPLRNIVLKQQLLARQSACVNETEMRIACRSENQKYDHPLVDLVPETQFSMGCDSVIYSKDPYKMGVLDDRAGRNRMPPGSENSGNLVQFLGSHLQPLYPRDGNLWAETTPSQCLLRSYGQVVCNRIGAGMGIDNFEKPVPAIRQFPRQVDGSNAFSICNGSDAKQGLRNEQVPKNVSNRENIMPCDCNCHYGNDHFVGSTFFLRYSCTADRCLKFGVNDIRNQRISSYHARNYGNYPVEMGGHRIVRLDGRVPVGKFSHGLRPNPNISKQSITTRVYYPNSWKLWSGFPEQELEGRVSMIDCRLTKGTSSPDVQYGNEKFRGQVGPEVSLYKYSTSEECHFAFHGPYAGPESPLSCVMAVATQEDLSPCSNNVTCKIPYQSLYGKFHDIPRNLHSSHHDLGTRQPLMDVEKVIDISRFSDDMAFKNKTEFKCNSKLSGEEAIIDSSSSYGNDAHNPQVGDASLLDFSLYNLSLSTSGEGSPMLSSAATINLAKASLKPQPKPEDAFDGGQLNIDPQVYESDGVPNPSLKVVAKVEEDHVNEKEIQLDLTSGLGIDEKAGNSECHKCTKVIGGIPGGLDAFYKNLATRELQTIKNSDLELIKELGSGTYGTVHHGKWKGSDVAIKRIKPSCFSEDSLEKDRLVADFWKEAHILGELHHPNIVAFYGVVTDGPVTNLATVTEYMVNGSLKQVLRRKDRTIDRRKRLIIAMDAAFGMEYLHGKNIVHFDLKSHNFLMNMRDPHRPVCKIGDLGLSKIKQRTLVSGGICGTIPWMAPELLNSKDNMVTEKVDVYSFGVVMWELLTGEEPYANMRSEEVIAGIIKGNLRPEVPSWCDPSWRSLMERCWSSDPDSRPSFSEIAKELRAMLPP